MLRGSFELKSDPVPARDRAHRTVNQPTPQCRHVRTSGLRQPAMPTDLRKLSSPASCVILGRSAQGEMNNMCTHRRTYISKTKSNQISMPRTKKNIIKHRAPIDRHTHTPRGFTAAVKLTYPGPGIIQRVGALPVFLAPAHNNTNARELAGENHNTHLV